MIGWDSSAWSLVFLTRANVGRWTLTFTVFAAGAPPTVAIVCQTIPHSLKNKPHCVRGLSISHAAGFSEGSFGLKTDSMVCRCLGFFSNKGV